MAKRANLLSAKYGEWQASLWGACVVAFGLGVVFHEYFGGILAWIVIVVGACLHAWGMQRINARNSGGVGHGPR